MRTMQNLHQMKIPKSAVLLALHLLWIFPFISLIVAYDFSAKADSGISSDVFFVSIAISDEMYDKLQGVAHRIGGVGLCLTSQAFLFIVFGVHYLRKLEFSAMDDEQSKPEWLQKASTFFGVITSVSLTGVSQFDQKFGLTSHFLFAIPFFVGGLLIMVTQSLIDWKVYGMGSKSSYRIFVVRLSLCLTAIISSLIFFFTYFIVEHWDIASAFELVTVVCFLSYWITWHGRFSSKMYLSIEKQDKQDEINIARL